MRDAEAAAFLEAEPEDERFATWHLALPDGSLAGRGAGGIDLLDAMSATRPIVSALRHVPESWLERGYDLVARYRGELGRLVPDGAAPRRFP